MAAGSNDGPPPEHTVTVVIPVYQGSTTLPDLIAEILPLAQTSQSPGRSPFRVSEVLLVDDNGPDGSASVIRRLAEEHELVRPVWLSRNFGQHAATLAGMASSSGDWVVTLDEDGQHDPADIPVLLDRALEEGASVVYAKPTNPAPHGALRNAASRGAKWLLARLFAGSNAPEYHSFRLVLGSVARGVAAYSGSGVYLDVALGWIAGRTALAPVAMREEGGRRSGYSGRRLFSHFWRMVLTSGTRGLRLVAALGIAFAVVGLGFAVYVLIARLLGGIETEGWASMVVAVLVSSGAILFSLGVIAEYIGINVNMAMGKPPYFIVSDPARGPLGRRPSDSP